MIATFVNDDAKRFLDELAPEDLDDVGRARVGESVSARNGREQGGAGFSWGCVPICVPAASSSYTANFIQNQSFAISGGERDWITTQWWRPLKGRGDRLLCHGL